MDLMYCRPTFVRTWTCVWMMISLGALFLAMKAYPGGSVLVPDAREFDILRNNWCDIFANTSINGRSNSGRLAAMSALACLVIASLPIWFLLPTDSTTKSRILRICGVAATVGSFFVPIDVDNPGFHSAAILGAGIPINVALGLTLWVVLVRGPNWLRFLGACTIISVAMNFGIWVMVAFGGSENTIALPLAQRIATLFLYVWIVSLAFQCVQSSNIEKV